MNQRELRLAIAFAAVFLLGGGFVAYNRLVSWKKSIETRELALAQKRVEAEGLFQQKDFWNTRSSWLNEQQPEYKNRNDADKQLLDYVKESASTHEVTLDLSQLDQPEAQAGVVAANMTVDAKAEYSKMWAWIHHLQSEPSKFIVVRGLDMKPNLEDTALLEVTQMRIQKWFKNPASQ
jgi:hypothetical protein